MKKQKYVPYFFDCKYERRTYKHIGKDYGNRVSANKGWIKNLLRWFRVRLYNKNETKYKECDTYEKWRSYVLSKWQFYNEYDKSNMIRFLNENKRIYDKILDVTKTIIIPIYIAIYSSVIAFLDRFTDIEEKTLLIQESSKSIYFIAFTLVIVIASYKWISANRYSIHFLEDYIECLNSK